MITDKYFECYCMIDFANSIATDIFTGKQIYILKKDAINRILASEKDKIVMNQIYGVHAKKLNLLTLPVAEQEKIKCECEKFKQDNNKIKSRKVIKR